MQTQGGILGACVGEMQELGDSRGELAGGRVLGEKGEEKEWMENVEEERKECVINRNKGSGERERGVGERTKSREGESVWI